MKIQVASARLDKLSALRLIGLTGSDKYVIDHVDHIRPLLRTIQGAKPDILILDWDLPFLQGGGPSGGTAVLIDTLRSTSHRMRIIVVAAQPEMEEEALSAGADAFVIRRAPPSGSSPEVSMQIRHHEENRSFCEPAPSA